ncbi:MAG: phosphogluconate dehydrogenase (NAD(+)-dependent, decarboxylating) [Candidatus Methylumidiphilus sp.]
MRLGMIGLGRMGGNMVRRLLRAGHECVAFDQNPDMAQALAAEGALAAATLQEFVAHLPAPRVVWLMLPAAIVDGALTELAGLLEPGDILIDGGNSHYVEDIRRAKTLAESGLQYIDVGTSGGVWGLERGYCMMIGGEAETVEYLDPIFQALAPGKGSIAETPSRSAETSADQGYLHCGQAGAGHFVKMVHNGIEYGMMAAYAEGFNILRRANVGQVSKAASAETAPMKNPEHFQYDFDLAEIAELWRRGSVVSSWLLDLTSNALAKAPDLENFSSAVSDSGEGRWTIAAAIDEGTPAPVLSAALFQRFSSRGEDSFACKILSAMRYEFGGHR